MTRKRITLALIESKITRKATFKKKRVALAKKMQEITTLCDIHGCVIFFSPWEDEPLVWPSKEMAAALLMKYESLPEKDQESKKVSHTEFMEERVNRLHEYVRRSEEKNKEAWGSILFHQINTGIKKMEDLNVVEAEVLVWYSEMKLNRIQRQNLLFPPQPVRAPPQVIPNPPLQDPPVTTPLVLVQPPQPDVEEGYFSAQAGDMADVEADSFIVEFESNAGVFDEYWIWPMNINEQNSLDFLKGFEPASNCVSFVP